MKFSPSLTVAALLLAVPAADAATVRVATPAKRSCQAPGLQGAALARHRVRRDSVVTVRLDARSGDWDLALRGRSASAGFGPHERVTTYARAGQTLVAKACRYSGRSTLARVSFQEIPYTAPARPAKISLVRVPLLGRASLGRLEATGLDVSHNVTDLFADVVLHGPADRRRLQAAGFVARTIVADLAKASSRRARAAQAAALPSGRTAYRALADYQTDLKKLVDENPALVKAVPLGTSIELRSIDAIEIATDVHRTDDGRPVIAIFGLHHAREWPSGEMPMEFAIDLVKNAASDPRIADLLTRVRVLVAPVVNPDGFVVSRSGREELGAVGEYGAYKRKNCRNTGGTPLPCALRLGEGIDLNRNYGAYWGGTGSGTSTTSQNYRGPRPYSEPESEAIHKLSQTRNIVNVVSHHTYTTSGVWLRQPGFCKTAGACSEQTDVVPDEPGMKALGDAMAEATGWTSQLGWKIGEITGATEDWNYFATGAYGYTPEQRGTNFHADFATMVVKEYAGVREALLRATGQAADPAGHSVIAGLAKPGTVLRLVKAFHTPTSQQGLTVADRLEMKLTVPADGVFRWAVNPSTRPLAGAPEAYVLLCETPDGQVLQTREIMVARGETATTSLGCGDPDPVLRAQESGTPDPTPTPTPEPQTAAPSPTPTPAPVAAPAAKPAPTIRITHPTRRFSAQRFNRRRGLTLTLRLDGGRVRDVVIRLVGAKGRVLAMVEARELTGDARLRLVAQRRARRGRAMLQVTAVDRRGRSVTAARRVTIVR